MLTFFRQDAVGQPYALFTAMSECRDISDPDAGQFRPLSANEWDCVDGAEDFVKGKFEIVRETCQVFTDMATMSIVVRGRLSQKWSNRPFEARLFENGKRTFEIETKEVYKIPLQ